MINILHKDIDPDFPLHCCAFNNLDRIRELIKVSTKEQLDKQDVYGNTALHIALMLKNEAISKCLLSAGCSVDIRNLEGWRPIDEITILGKRSMALIGFGIYHDQVIANCNESVTSATLSSVPDCEIDFDWEFKSWIPFLARHLPSDSCKLYKKGNKIRLDTTLLDFKNRDWIRGQLSIIVDASKPFQKRICLIDHKQRLYQILDGALSDENGADWLERTVSTSLHMPVVRMRVEIDQIKYRKQASVLIWNKEPIVEKIGKYRATIYTFNNVRVSVKKRTEHLTKEDRRYFSTMKSQIKEGTVAHAVKTAQKHNCSQNDSNLTEVELLAVNPQISWKTYRGGRLQGVDRYLGSKPQIKDQSREVKLNVAVTEEIDFYLPHLLDLLKCFSPLRKFTKLNETVLAGLPAGFPVRIDVPIFPTITGRVTFKSILHCDHNKGSKLPPLQIEDNLFQIPGGYVESFVLE